MADEQKERDLRAALESYARKVRGLTAENLEGFKGILESLGNEDVSADPSRRLQLAERVRSTIVGAIDGCSDKTDRLVGKAMFASDEDLHGLGVMRRLANCNVSVGTYYSRRDGFLSRVLRALQREFDDQQSEASPAQDSLSPEARRAARQLYRYAQNALVRIEAYGFCNTFAHRLEMRLNSTNPTQVPHSWLANYRSPTKPLRLVPDDRTSVSDAALWAFAHFSSYLRALLQDRSSRDYLRESLSSGAYLRLQRGDPFRSEAIEELLSCLAVGDIDEPQAFVDRLCDHDMGRGKGDYWLACISGTPYNPSGFLQVDDDADLDGFGIFCTAITSDLLSVCVLLQSLCPKDTLIDRRGISRDAMRVLIEEAIEYAPDMPLQKRQVFVDALLDDICRRQPPRYFANEQGQEAWNHDPPDNDLWSFL